MLNAIVPRTLACAAVLLMSGTVAADQVQSRPQGDPKAPIADTKPDPTLTPRDISEREQEYLVALRKCEPLAEAQRQNCIKAVKNKYGLM
jgi:hypothetical protein